MLNAQDADAAVKALTYPRGISDRDERVAAHRSYNEAVSNITGEFKAWLANTYASSLPARLQDRIFGKAWEDGHSSGYGEVENHYIDIADVADFAFRLGKQAEAAKSINFPK